MSATEDVAKAGFEVVALSPALTSRLEKAAVDNGFDRVLSTNANWIEFASTQCSLRLWLGVTTLRAFAAAFSKNNVGTAHGISAMQIDLMPDPDGIIRAGQLIDALSGSNYPRRWLFNAKASAAPLTPPNRMLAQVHSAGATAGRNRSRESGPHFCWRCSRITEFSIRGNALRCICCGTEFLG